MAKHRRRRRGGRRADFQALRVEQEIGVGALINGNVLTSTMTALGETEYQVVSMDLVWSKRDGTAGEGPFQVGVANGDLNATEIAEALDANPTSPADIVLRERAKRPVRHVGSFAGLGEENLNDGKPIRTRLWTKLANGIEMEFWVRNRSGATLTTGMVVNVSGVIYGYWA